MSLFSRHLIFKNLFPGLSQFNSLYSAPAVPIQTTGYAERTMMSKDKMPSVHIRFTPGCLAKSVQWKKQEKKREHKKEEGIFSIERQVVRISFLLISRKKAKPLTCT